MVRKDGYIPETTVKYYMEMCNTEVILKQLILSLWILLFKILIYLNFVLLK
jgi:hypothetical protein